MLKSDACNLEPHTLNTHLFKLFITYIASLFGMHEIETHNNSREMLKFQPGFRKHKE